MALIDVVEWSARSNDVYAWRFPHSNLSTWTQLVVRESQEAVFFSKGKLMGKFGPGKHKLTTENLPLLRTLYGIPFGGRNPFVAEVWFVNKAMPLNIKWRTTPVRVNDAEYGVMVPVVASGRYGVTVEDAEKFLVKLNGTRESFTRDDLTDQFMGPLVTRTNSVVSSYMSANRVGVNQVGAQLQQLSNFLAQPMSEFWAGYGLRLTEFYVHSIDVDDSTEEGRMIRRALAELSEMGILGEGAWQQHRAFDMADNALSRGGDMGILGAAMLPGIMSGMMPGGGFAGGSFTPRQDQNGDADISSVPKRVFCARCGKMYSPEDRYCPNCGHRYNPCPVCGSDNLSNASRCVSCGYDLATWRSSLYNEKLYLNEVDFSIVAPKKVNESIYSTIYAIMYEKQFREIVEDLKTLVESKTMEMRAKVTFPPVATSIRVILESDDVEVIIKDADQSLPWNGGYLYFSFLFKIAEGRASETIPFTCKIYAMGILLTQLSFVVDCSISCNRVLSVNRNDKKTAFVSYSSADRSRVVSIMQGIKAARPDLKVFFDILSIETGDDWEKAIEDALSRTDILFLCWSRSARNSKYVDYEWRHILQTKGIDAIVPIPIDPPSECPPPDELNSKHFNDILIYMSDRFVYTQR